MTNFLGVLALTFAIINTFAAAKVFITLGKATNLYKLRSSRYLLIGSVEAYLGVISNVFNQILKNNWFFFATVLIINLAVYHFLCWSALIWTGDKIKYGKIFARPKAKNFLAAATAYALFAFFMAGDDFNNIWLVDAEKIVTNFWLWSARIVGLSFAAFGMIILAVEIAKEGKRRKDTTKAWSEFSFFSYQIIVFCSILFLGSGLIRVILYGFIRQNWILQIFTIIGYSGIFAGLVIFSVIVLFDRRLLPAYEVFTQARCRSLLAELKTFYAKANEKFPTGYRIDPYDIKIPRYALVALVENLNEIRRTIWRTEAWERAEKTNKQITEINLGQINEADLWQKYLNNAEKAQLAKKYEAKISPANIIPEIKTTSIEQTADYFVGIAKQVE